MLLMANSQDLDSNRKFVFVLTAEGDMSLAATNLSNLLNRHLKHT